jgi:hypothetical protein
MKMMRVAPMLFVVLAAGCAHPEQQPAPPAASAAPSRTGSARGEMLYENHCTSCHTSVVHVQENHRATSDLEVESWVRLRSRELKLDWSDEDVTDVTEFLLQRFYKF